MDTKKKELVGQFKNAGRSWELEPVIAKWWRTASNDYTGKHRLLILADGGGSNSARGRAWKAFVQTQLADRFGLEVTVCHYPPGTSKWNPIEHRLFSEISKNWSGKPLDSYDTILNYIRTKRTASGLKVREKLLKMVDKNGITITKEVFTGLSLERHETLPQWNYTLKPRQNA